MHICLWLIAPYKYFIFLFFFLHVFPFLPYMLSRKSLIPDRFKCISAGQAVLGDFRAMASLLWQLTLERNNTSSEMLFFFSLFSLLPRLWENDSCLDSAFVLYRTNRSVGIFRCGEVIELEFIHDELILSFFTSKYWGILPSLGLNT